MYFRPAKVDLLIGESNQVLRRSFRQESKMWLESVDR